MIWAGVSGVRAYAAVQMGADNFSTCRTTVIVSEIEIAILPSFGARARELLITQSLTYQFFWQTFYKLGARGRNE